VGESALLVANQGVPFTHNRIKSLVRYGASDKVVGKWQRGLIGYKGVGFTSVFEVSDNPQIDSTTATFEFDRKRAKKTVRDTLGKTPKDVPTRYFPFHPLSPEAFGDDHEVVEDLKQKGAISIIRLPYRTKFDQKRVWKDILDSIHPEVLLFMEHLEGFEVSDGEETISWFRENSRKIGAGQLVHLHPNEGDTRSWVIARDAAKPSKRLLVSLDDPLWTESNLLNVAIALPWEKGLGVRPRGETPPLHVYYPTKDRLGRELLIHGDFYVDSTRKRIETDGPGGEVSRLVAHRNLSTKVRHFLFEFTEQLPVAFPSHLA